MCSLGVHAKHAGELRWSIAKGAGPVQSRWRWRYQVQLNGCFHAHLRGAVPGGDLRVADAAHDLHPQPSGEVDGMPGDGNSPSQYTAQLLPSNPQKISKEPRRINPGRNSPRTRETRSRATGSDATQGTCMDSSNLGVVDWSCVA